MFLLLHKLLGRSLLTAKFPTQRHSQDHPLVSEKRVHGIGTFQRNEKRGPRFHQLHCLEAWPCELRSLPGKILGSYFSERCNPLELWKPAFRIVKSGPSPGSMLRRGVCAPVRVSCSREQQEVVYALHF